MKKIQSVSSHWDMFGFKYKESATMHGLISYSLVYSGGCLEEPKDSMPFPEEETRAVT